MTCKSSEPSADDEEQSKELHSTQNILQTPSESRSHCMDADRKCCSGDRYSTQLPGRRFNSRGQKQVRGRRDSVASRYLLAWVRNVACG